MGRVSAFLGMVLYMYPEKNGRHNRPHVHVLYGDEECVLSIPEGLVLAGEIPSRQLRNAQGGAEALGWTAPPWLPVGLGTGQVSGRMGAQVSLRLGPQDPAGF